MKIAISSIGEDKTSEVSTVFARCPYFIFAEVENGKIKWTETVKNENGSQPSGAGIAMAQKMAENNINAVISGNIGPRAMDILKQFDIKAYAAKGIVEEALQSFVEGKTEEIR